MNLFSWNFCSTSVFLAAKDVNSFAGSLRKSDPQLFCAMMNLNDSCIPEIQHKKTSTLSRFFYVILAEAFTLFVKG